MKSKTMILLVVAAGCGLVASYMTSRLLAERNQKVQVLVAKANFAPWTTIKNPDDMFELEERTKVDTPRNAVTSVEGAADHVLAKRMEKGDVLVSEYLQSRDKASLDVVLPPGKRAVAVRTTQEAVAGGFVLPDSQVDVIHTVRRGDRGPESRVILQDVKVLAVDQLDRKPEGDKVGVVPATVTLMLDPDQVQVITRAQTEGIITLSLRSRGDTAKIDYEDQAPVKPVEPEKAEPKEAVVEEKPPEPPAERKTLTVHNGSQTIRATFTIQNGEIRTDIERSQHDATGPRSQPAPMPAPPSNDAGSGENSDN
jgi:pilus assembly protein CpaB